MSSGREVLTMCNNETAERPKTSPNAHERAERFLTDLLSAHRAYHQHKENMAYAGAALYVLAFGAALTGETWPPAWWLDDPFWRRWGTVAAITTAWFVVLLYLRWQLGLRYWTAVHVAATQELLAKWITDLPKDEDLEPWKPPSNHSKDSNKFARNWRGNVWRELKRSSRWIADWICPSRRLTVKPDVPYAVYPKAVVEAWLKQAERGSGAVFHSRLVLCASWSIYVALLARTLMWDP